MIDFHSHIIPNIDDGSKSMEQTLEMLKEASQAGFTDIISTSHFIDGSYDVDKNEREILINDIKSNAKNNNLNIEIYNGSEAYISNDICELVKNEKIATINNSKYLLFELPMNNKVLYLDSVIYDLLSIGIVPVIAHPERYSYIQEDPNILIDLIDKGVLFQCNYSSIIGKYGSKAQKTFKKLLKHNMVHFLGTDAHRNNSVYTHINKCTEKIEKIIGKEELHILSTVNPQKTINNQEIEVKEPIKIKGFGIR